MTIRSISLFFIFITAISPIASMNQGNHKKNTEQNSHFVNHGTFNNSGLLNVQTQRFDNRGTFNNYGQVMVVPQPHHYYSTPQAVPVYGMPFYPQQKPQLTPEQIARHHAMEVQRENARKEKAKNEKILSDLAQLRTQKRLLSEKQSKYIENILNLKNEAERILIAEVALSQIKKEIHEQKNREEIAHKEHIANLNDLQIMQNFLPKEERSQIGNLVNLSEEERISQVKILSSSTEIKNIKKLTSFLTENDTQGLPVKSESKSLEPAYQFDDPRFVAASQKKESYSWYNVQDALSSETKDLQTQLELFSANNPSNNLDTWNKIISSRTA